MFESNEVTGGGGKGEEGEGGAEARAHMMIVYKLPTVVFSYNLILFYKQHNILVVIMTYLFQ